MYYRLWVAARKNAITPVGVLVPISLVALAMICLGAWLQFREPTSERWSFIGSLAAGAGSSIIFVEFVISVMHNAHEQHRARNLLNHFEDQLEAIINAWPEFAELVQSRSSHEVGEKLLHGIPRYDLADDLYRWLEHHGNVIFGATTPEVLCVLLENLVCSAANDGHLKQASTFLGKRYANIHRARTALLQTWIPMLRTQSEQDGRSQENKRLFMVQAYLICAGAHVIKQYSDRTHINPNPMAWVKFGSYQPPEIEA